MGKPPESLGTLKEYLSQLQIAELNQKLGHQISQDYKKTLKPGESVLVVVTLKGALFFAADLMRHLDFSIQVDFVRLASYGSGTKSSGNVRVLKDLEDSPEGRHLLILDEIVDSGRTLKFLKERLEAQRPKSVRLAALLSKPSRREVEIAVDYLGQEVEDRFLVGYGLDYAENYRNLPDIRYVE